MRNHEGSSKFEIKLFFLKACYNPEEKYQNHADYPLFALFQPKSSPNRGKLPRKRSKRDFSGPIFRLNMHSLVEENYFLASFGSKPLLYNIFGFIKIVFAFPWLFYVCFGVFFTHFCPFWPFWG